MNNRKTAIGILILTSALTMSLRINAQSVKIGNKEWMTKNLNTSTFRNGNPIKEAKTAEEFGKAGDNEQPAWCYFENDLENGKKYGKLYNWYAVNDPRGLAPAGWHIPNDEEWTALTDFLGVASTKMKSKYGWEENSNGTNESGISGLPGGFRSISGNFYAIGEYGYWWSSTESRRPHAWTRPLGYYSGYVIRNYLNMKLGFSVRCLRD
ncbi:hypothetical protein ES705_10150 [subsurface metagenome]